MLLKSRGCYCSQCEQDGAERSATDVCVMGLARKLCPA